MSFAHIGLFKGPVALEGSIPSGSYALSASSFTGFPEPQGGGGLTDRDIPFRAEFQALSVSA